MKESIVKAVKEMIEAPSCCPELETAGERFGLNHLAQMLKFPPQRH